jgi:oligopeptide/dipeptide ABC transporter ATP-binding protein
MNETSKSNQATDALLEVSNLSVKYGSGKKGFVAVSDIALEIAPGETLGVVGESGSGKSTIGKAILGLEKAHSGSIRFLGRDITHHSLKQRKKSAEELRVVFQDPYSSLNPDMTIGATLIEPLGLLGVGKDEAMRRAREVLVKVGLPAEAVDRLPRNFSGGQRQRIAIARALIVDPKLIVLDEPVSALDLSTQAQVLNLLADLAASENVGFLFIAHDIDVVRFLSDRVVVLYKGRIMETGPVEEVVTNPRHPYTQGLIAAAPVPRPAEQAERRKQWLELQERKNAMTGVFQMQGPAIVGGCPYFNRCSISTDICGKQVPELREIGNVKVACHHAN